MYPGIKVLLASDAEPDTWQEVMDKMLQEDPLGAVSRIRWKPSRHGGKPFASPSALPQQLAAARRVRANKPKCKALESITHVDIKGHVQADEHAVLQHLMQHLGQIMGITLVESKDVASASSGSWRWLAASDPAAPPGRIRLFLSDEQEVHRVVSALHGKSIKVGSDLIGIQVSNDLRDANSLMHPPGNGLMGATSQVRPQASLD